MKTIKIKLDYLRKQSLFNETSEKKFLSFTTKLIEKIQKTLVQVKPKITINFIWWKKWKIGKKMQNYSSTTRNCRKPKLPRTTELAKKLILTKILIALYVVKQKTWKFFEWKKCKNNQNNHILIEVMSTYNVEILNYFNLELELKDKEFAITYKLINLLCELRGFISVTTLVFKCKKKEKKKTMKQNIPPFLLTQKQKYLLMKVILMIHLNQSML